MPHGNYHIVSRGNATTGLTSIIYITQKLIFHIKVTQLTLMTMSYQLKLEGYTKFSVALMCGRCLKMCIVKFCSLSF